MPVMRKPGLQDQLLQIISERFPSRSDMVDDICRILEFSKDSAYRRLRGESIFTPDQLATLALHYKISLDRVVFGQTNNVMFTFNAFNQNVREFDDYFNGILNHIKMVLAIPEVKIQYASLEIPIFYYCFFPELISFKLYVWGRSVWDLPYTRDLPFAFDLISPSALEKSREMLDCYLRLPSLQMWSLNIFDNTINQIAYHLTSGLFRDPEDAVILLECLEGVCQHMRQMAAEGHKFPIRSRQHLAPLEVYHNEMIYTNNTILVQSPYFKAVFTTFGNPNFLVSTDERLTQYTGRWFSSVLEKAHPLSLGSEKSRNWFFDQLLHKVRDARNKVSFWRS